MSQEDERDLLLRAVNAEEQLELATRKLKRIRHLVRTYNDVCDEYKDEHAARIVGEIRKVTGDT